MAPFINSLLKRPPHSHLQLGPEQLPTRLVRVPVVLQEKIPTFPLASECRRMTVEQPCAVILRCNFTHDSLREVDVVEVDRSATFLTVKAVPTVDGTYSTTNTSVAPTSAAAFATACASLV